MNPRFMHIARLLHAVGGDRNAVASAMGRSRKYVDNVMARPDAREYCAMLESATVAPAVTFDGMLQKAVKVLDAALDDPEMPLSKKVKVAEIVLDRHPDGEFVKRSKQEQGRSARTRGAVSGETIDRLARAATKQMLLKGNRDEEETRHE